MSDLNHSIAQAKLLRHRIEAAELSLKNLRAELAPLEETIVAAAEGIAETDAKGTRRAELVTPDGTVKITWPIATLKLTAENLADVRALAGDAFSKIAEKIPLTHKLLKSAREVIPALFTAAKAKKLHALLLAEPAAPRLSYS